MSWKDYAIPLTEDEVAAYKAKYKPASQEDVLKSTQIQPEQISNTESFLRGGAQSFALNFADEIEAGIKSAMDSGLSYEDAIKEVRQRYKEAQKNEAAYFGGAIAGGIAQAVTPGLGMLSAGKTAGQAIATGLASGAIAGIGESEDKLSKEAAKNAAIGAGIGGALPVAVGGIGAAATAFTPQVAKAFSKGTEGKLLIGQAGKDFAESQIKRESQKALADITDIYKKPIEEQKKFLETKAKELSVDPELLSKFRDDAEEYINNSDIGLTAKKQLKETLSKAFKDKEVVEKSIKPISKTYKETASSRAKLQEEIAAAKAQAKALGINVEGEIVENVDPTSGDKFLTRILRKTEEGEPDLFKPASKRVAGQFQDEGDKSIEAAKARIAALKSKAEIEGKPFNYDIQRDDMEGIVNVVENRPQIFEPSEMPVREGLSAKTVKDVPGNPETNVKIFKPENIKEIITKFRNNEPLTIDETYAISNALKDYKGEGQPGSISKQLAEDLRSDVIYKSSPELREINKKINLSNDAIKALTGREKGYEYLAASNKGTPGELSALETDLMSQILAYGKDSDSAIKANKRLEDYIKAIEAAGLDSTKAKQVAERMKVASEDLELSRLTQDENVGALNPLILARQTSIKFANPAGYMFGQGIQKSLERGNPAGVLGGMMTGTTKLLPKAIMATTSDDVQNQPAAQSRSLYDMSNDDVMKTVSDRLGDDPKYAQTVERLQQAISENNSQMKNATLFKLLQDPKARMKLKGEAK